MSLRRYLNVSSHTQHHQTCATPHMTFRCGADQLVFVHVRSCPSTPKPLCNQTRKRKIWWIIITWMHIDTIYAITSGSHGKTPSRFTRTTVKKKRIPRYSRGKTECVHGVNGRKGRLIGRRAYIQTNLDTKCGL